MSNSTSKKTQKPHIANAKVLYTRLLRYAWRYKTVFIISILASVVFSATNSGFLYAIKRVTDEGFVKQAPHELLSLPLMLWGLMSLRAIAGFSSTFAMRWVARRVVEALRRDAFKQLMQLPLCFFDARSAGVVTSKLLYDVEQMANTCTKVAQTLVRDMLTAIGILGYMLYLDWRLTLLFIAIAPLIAFYLKQMTPKLRANGQHVQQSVGEMTKAAEEAIAGQRIVKIFGAANYEYERFAGIAGINRQMQIRLARISGINSMVVELLAAFALALVVYYAIQNFTAGEFAAFLSALLMLIPTIKTLTAVNEELQVGLAAAQSVFEVIDSQEETDEGDKKITRSNGNIEFKNVTLRFGEAKRAALDNLSFSIKSGEKVALVGRSGGGKTTLVNLLPRFYELQQGIILLDGIDIRALELKNLREQFALVSQDIILFNDTIFNNIAYGVLRNASETEVIAAAKAAHAWEFIEQLPLGLQNEIGDRGVRLSGGQRQRIAIARAILKNAPILLLDEATSALDSESEQHVQAALDALMQNRTSIVIAHRLSTIENADRILVMDQGHIVEAGSHTELLLQKGYYTKLYQKEFSGS
ncbi:MAG: lipid A export permease/ATP-binding protein MsbA [Methylophilaceae bacterium]